MSALDTLLGSMDPQADPNSDAAVQQRNANMLAMPLQDAPLPNGLQDAVNRLLQDPVLRKSLNIVGDSPTGDNRGTGNPGDYQPTAQNPAGVPIGRDQQFAMNNVGRINADSATTHVQGSIDANGRLVLTNAATPPQNVVGAANAGNVGIATPNTPTAISSLMNQLKAAPDSDTADGIAAILRQGISLQKGALEAQAATFADNKVGVPALQAQLDASIAADQRDPAYYPGIGDSPITAKLRAEVNTARTASTGVAKTYLTSNVDYNTLTATAATADQTIKDIAKKSDVKDNLTANLQLRSAQKAADRADQLAEISSGLNDSQRTRIDMLNPSVLTADNPDAARAQVLVTASKTKNVQLLNVISADASQLPTMAVQGNQYATNLVIANEANKVGTDPAVTSAKLDSIRQLANNPKLIATYYQSAPNMSEAEKKQAITAFNLKSNSPIKDDKEAVNAMRYQMAFSIAKQKATDDFANNTQSWGITDPTFQAAVNTATATAKSTKLPDVLTAYIGNSTGQEAILKAQALTEIMSTAAAKREGSMFGMPDIVKLRGYIAEKARRSVIPQSTYGLGVPDTLLMFSPTDSSNLTGTING